MEPIYSTLFEFVPQECRQDIQKGLEDNKKTLEIKIMETKDLMRESEATEED